jgi:hypothetical protein
VLARKIPASAEDKYFSQKLKTFLFMNFMMLERKKLKEIAINYSLSINKLEPKTLP